MPDVGKARLEPFDRFQHARRDKGVQAQGRQLLFAKLSNLAQQPRVDRNLAYVVKSGGITDVEKAFIVQPHFFSGCDCIDGNPLGMVFLARRMAVEPQKERPDDPISLYSFVIGDRDRSTSHVASSSGSSIVRGSSQTLPPSIRPMMPQIRKRAKTSSGLPPASPTRQVGRPVPGADPPPISVTPIETTLPMPAPAIRSAIDRISASERLM